jgi:hypothetical protein
MEETFELALTWVLMTNRTSHSDYNCDERKEGRREAEGDRYNRVGGYRCWSILVNFVSCDKINYFDVDVETYTYLF